EYVHSFSTSVIAFSAALCGTAEGFTILSYADEFYVFFRVLENLSSAISYSSSSFGSISYLPFKFAKQEFAISEPENAETTAHGAPLNYSNSLFSINGTFKIKSVAIILHKSRISANVDSSVGNSDVSSSKKLAKHDLPDCGISISIHQTTADLSWKEGKVKNYLSSDNVSNAPGTSASIDKAVHVENLPFTTNSESSNGQDCRFLQDIEFASNVPPPGSALATFVNCFASYLHCFANLLSGLQSSDEHIEEAEISVDTTRPNDHSVQEYMQETHCTSQQAQITQMEAFILNISHFSCVLVIEDEHGGMQELVLEVDVHLNFQVTNMRRKLVFDLSRMSILAQAFQEIVENEIQIPHFSSVTSNVFPSDVVSGSSAEFSHHGDRIHPVNDASCSRDPGPQEEFSVHNSLPEAFRPIHQNYILKHAGAVISVEKPLNDSLCLNEMLLSMISSFSGVFKEEMISEPDRRHQSSNEEFKNSLETMIPNGAIVAIQDVHQHMYFTVEGEENKFNLVGVVHYSLVGERALFRVKYHNQGRWKSSVSWFSLISLYAKNDLGEPLRLNYRPGSGFVDLSSANDNGWALWKAISCKPENSEGDIDWEPNIQLVQRTFYLLNKKSDSAVAFVDGIPEFVRKPGNPFKLKVFHNASVARDIKMDSYPGEASGTSLQHDALRDDGNTSVRSGKLPCIDVTFDKISLTIFHELVDTEDMRELLHPVEVCLFYRSSFQLQGSQAVSHGVPVHIHCRTKELNISLSELSLDILLFVIGKLNLAGPYSVRSNKIWANCCKVVNQSGSDLLCHFFDKQSVTVSRMQSASVILRCSDLANQPPEIASVVSIQLAVPGSFVTKSIDVSLIETQVLAWKTQITSLQDSKNFPGPFVVVDVSRKSEDGLSIVISPLIRIHNETGLPMELRFRRAQQKEDEFASVMLNAGDTIDDSMAMFDALNLSGGRKKALMSLGLDGFMTSKNSLSVEWSDDLKGGKAVRLSGIFDRLSYRVRNALFTESVKCSFSTAQCTLKSEGANRCYAVGSDNDRNQSTISCGSMVEFYANPSIIYFTVTLTAYNSSCRPVNSSDWVKKLQKQKGDVPCLDIDLDFGGGKYFASLRLSRGNRGTLEAAIFTSYSLRNDTEFTLCFYVPNKRPLSRPNKMCLRLLQDNASETLIDLDALSGLAEISLEVEDGSGVKYITKLGVSTGPPLSRVDDSVGMIPINSKQRATLQLQDGMNKKRDFSLFEHIMKRHRKVNDDSLIYLQFRLNESKLGWSGPVCIASLGRFFLKFKKPHMDQATALESSVTEFAAVHVVEEGSTLVLRFHKPPNVSLPYRIENCLHDVSITYYQKDSLEPEILGSESGTDYVWDDLTLPHKLIVFYYVKLTWIRYGHGSLSTNYGTEWVGISFTMGKRSVDQRIDFGELNAMEMVKVGYEVYADGPTRVLRFCEISRSHKGDKMFHSCEKIQLRDGDDMEPSAYTPILAARIGNINFDSLFTHEQKFSQICVQSVNLEHKWVGAPFAAMLRRHESDYNDSNDCVLKIVVVFLSTSSNVVQVKYSSIALQPMDLNLDEETLMKIVPFWRTSLSNSKSQQYYFDHFEIHPIKIFANFLPGDSYSSYSSAEETLRSLLHSVVKVPAIKNKVVELNGVMVTHALITMLENSGVNVLFAAVTEISDSVLKGAEASGFNGVVTGFHQGILKLAMEPSLLGTALMEGGPDRKIKLDRSPAADELYIEGYLQAMLDTVFRQEYLRVRVIDNQVYLKNLPPNSSLIEEIMDRVKGFLVSKALLKGDPSITSRPLSHLRGESEWRLGPTVLTLCEHLFVSFAIRLLRKQANKFIAGIKWNSEGDIAKAVVPANPAE
ncbi:Protein of unknown function D, partial [Prunus dulcis]